MKNKKKKSSASSAVQKKKSVKNQWGKLNYKFEFTCTRDQFRKVKSRKNGSEFIRSLIDAAH